MIENIIENNYLKMQQCIEIFKNHIKSIRTSRASPELLNSIYVEYFGKKVALRHVSNVIVEDTRTLKINVFDESITLSISKAILNSNLGLNPVIYGKDIRVPLPVLTEERRKNLVKLVKSDAENSRILIRNIRRDSNDKIKSLMKKKMISEDLERSSQVEIQLLTDKFIKEIDILLLKKEKDLMYI